MKEEEESISFLTVPEMIIYSLGGDNFLEIIGGNEPKLDEQSGSVELQIQKNEGDVDRCKITTTTSFPFFDMEFWKDNVSSDGTVQKENYQKIEHIYKLDLADTFQEVTGLHTHIRFLTPPEIILSQIGGREFLLSAGAHNIKMDTAEDGESDPSISMNFHPSNDLNHLSIYLRGDDTYSMVFSQRMEEKDTGKITITNEKKFDDVYFHMLRDIFQDVTGIRSYLEDINESQAIFALLGGKEFEYMTGSRNIQMHSEVEEPWISLDFACCSKFNHLEVHLKKNDTYTMIFSKSQKKIQETQEIMTDRCIYENLLFTQLRNQFEKTTGLTTHMPTILKAMLKAIQSGSPSSENKQNKGISH